MKRSEMVKIMDKAYGEWVDMWVKSNLGEGLPNMQDYILKAMEEAGMEPPGRFEECESGGCRIPDMYYEWEPEDK